LWQLIDAAFEVKLAGPYKIINKSVTETKIIHYVFLSTGLILEKIHAKFSNSQRLFESPEQPIYREDRSPLF